MAQPALTESWTGEDVALGAVEAQLARLRIAGESAPNLRTSVMTHVAWVPERWREAAEAVLAGMAEAHPSRTILLLPDPDSPHDRIDANVSVECYDLRDVDRHVCSEIVELRLHGRRAAAPASIVVPLLLPDLPVFCRWRGEPPFGAPELEGLLEVVDRLIVDSSEWVDPAAACARLAELFERTAVSDLAWARTARWRAGLAALWPEVASVRTLRVVGPRADALLLAAWLRSRLGRPDVELVHQEGGELERVEADGDPVEPPFGGPAGASEILSAELDRLARDPVYEAAVRSARG